MALHCIIQTRRYCAGKIGILFTQLYILYLQLCNDVILRANGKYFITGKVLTYKKIYANEFDLCILMSCVFDTATIIRY